MPSFPCTLQSDGFVLQDWVVIRLNGHRAMAIAHESLLKEQLSISYLSAIVAQAGVVTDIPTIDVESIDITVRGVGLTTPSGLESPRLDIQLKATTSLKYRQQDEIAFPLKRKNYDDLRKKSFTPRLLVVLFIPVDQQDWLDITESGLVLKHCAYFVATRNLPDAKNKASVTVKFPRKNILTPQSLRDLLISEAQP